MNLIDVFNFKKYFKRTGDSSNAKIGHVNAVIEKITDLEKTIVNITLTQLITDIANGDIVAGSIYHITDRGIYLEGLNADEVSLTGHRIMKIVKNLYYTPDVGVLGVWNANITPTVDDVTIWGGKVWKNLSGAVGAPIDDTTLDPTDWELIPTTNDTYYFTKRFGCSYDIVNDWVASQWDDRGNFFTSNWILGVNFGYTISPIDFSDWGNEKIFNNTCFGIYNNSNSGFIALNSNTGAIYNNSNIGYILNNSNSESISYNSNTGSISYNSNSGSIFYNSNTGNIYNNSNSGIIYNNSNSGSISNNSNTGIIDSITSDTTEIEYNTNNGDISTTVVGSISDPIVNK